jgi:adenosylhomocysteine nucleosidase
MVEPFTVPLLDKKSFDTDPVRNRILATAVALFLQEREKHLAPGKLSSFEISDPKSFEGAIASGDQFISDAASIERIRKGLPDVLCVEMEGAAVAQVCYEYRIPFNIIRTISDKANDNAHIDFPSFASEIASPYAKGIIRNYLGSL